MLVVLGSVLMVIYNLLFFIGLKTGLAGAGGVLVTTLAPLFTFFLTIFIFKKRTQRKELLGLALGFFGGLILIKIWQFDLQEMLLSGNLFFLFAALTWSFLTIISQKSNKYMQALVFSFYIFALSSILKFFLAFDKGILDVFNLSLIFWSNIIFLSVIATTFATTIYFYASSKLGAEQAGSFMFLVPISSVGISWLVLGEIPKITTLVGGALTIFAVYLINYSVAQKKASEKF